MNRSNSQFPMAKVQRIPKLQPPKPSKVIGAVSVGDVDGIAGRAGEIAHNGATVTQDGIDERGFSDVRPTDNREGQRGRKS